MSSSLYTYANEVSLIFTDSIFTGTHQSMILANGMREKKNIMEDLKIRKYSFMYMYV